MGEAIIIGGGIGGLAAALALRRVGIDAQVYERAPEIREVGAGLSLWSNAVLALRSLGVDGALLPRASRIDKVVNLTAAGAPISVMDLTGLAAAAGMPSICAHRADLQASLRDALPPDSVHLDHNCTGIDTDDAGVTARFEGGRSARAAILIGADGIHSAVRASLFGRETPRWAGYVAWRAIAHIEHRDLPLQTAKFALGRGTQLGFFRCGPGRSYWFATINGRAGENKDPAAWKQEALQLLNNWMPLARDVVGATDPTALIKTDVIDRPPTWPWGRGRVTLLGDAIHPTTPNLGQGAGMALEDAIVLADRLRAGFSAAGLRAYEQARRARTRMVTDRSWSLGRTLQMENRLGCWVRDWTMGMSFSQWLADSLFRQLLVHELPVLHP